MWCHERWNSTSDHLMRIFRKLTEPKLIWTCEICPELRNNDYLFSVSFFLDVWFFFISENKCWLHFSDIFQLVTINNSQLPERSQQHCVVPISVESIERGSDNCLDVIQVRWPFLHQVQKFLKNEEISKILAQILSYSDLLVHVSSCMSKRFVKDTRRSELAVLISVYLGKLWLHIFNFFSI